MKKTFLISLTVGVLLSALPAQAGLFTMDQATLNSMTKVWDSDYMDGTTSSDVTTLIVGDAVRYSGSMWYGDGTGEGWAAIGIGFGWDAGGIPAELQDLTAYDGFSLEFLNTNNSTWSVNLYMNTGWTDPPADPEGDQFYESTWTALAPGESVILVLDFAGVSNLNHVTNIGFQIAANMDEFPYEPNTNNPSNGDIYHIDVTAIPEPATLMLLGLGGILLRKRK